MVCGEERAHPERDLEGEAGVAALRGGEDVPGGGGVDGRDGAEAAVAEEERDGRGAVVGNDERAEVVEAEDVRDRTDPLAKSGDDLRPLADGVAQALVVVGVARDGGGDPHQGRDDFFVQIALGRNEGVVICTLEMAKKPFPLSPPKGLRRGNGERKGGFTAEICEVGGVRRVLGGGRK